MPFPIPLDSTAIAQTRANYAAEQYMVFGSNTVIFAARVNDSVREDITYAQIIFDTVTVGAYTDIEEGMSIYICASADPKTFRFKGRMRLDGVAGVVATSTILYFDETSQVVGNNDYIFVVRDFALHSKFAKATATTYLKDFNQAYHAPKPVLYNFQSAYVGVADAITGVYRQAFALSAFAAASGASMSTYLATLPSGVSLHSGSLSTLTFTLDFTPRQAEYWIKVAATDTNGQPQTIHFPVFAIPSDFSTTIHNGVEGGSIEGSLDNGFSLTFNAFADVADILDETLCVVFEVERHDGVVGSIVTPVKFVGRLQQDSGTNSADDSANRILNIPFQVEGLAAQLTRTPMEHIKAIIKSSPSVWDEIKNLTPWRAIVHYLQTHTTFLEINSLIFDDTTDTYIYPSFPTQGSSVIDAIKDVLVSLNAGMEWAQSGEARVVVDVRYTDVVADVIANFDSDDFIEIGGLEHKHIPEVALINAAGGSYSTANGQETIVAAKWPGITAGRGFRLETFNRQVLAANLSKADASVVLRFRTGYHAAVLDTLDRLTISHPDNYNWIIPTRAAWYTWTLSVDDQDGLRHDFDTNTKWICESVSIQHDNTNGTKPTVQAVYVRKTQATPGQEYIPDSTGEVPPVNPSIPPTDTYPSWPDDPLPPDLPPADAPPYTGPTSPTAPAPSDGSVMIAVTLDTDSHLWVTRQGTLSSPPWVGLDPPLATGETITDACLSGLGLDAYMLANNGTTSHVYYTDNVLKTVQAWQVSADLTGIYSKIRTTDTAGKIYIEKFVAGGGSTTILTLAATEHDLDTGIALTSGDTIEITATGTWCYSGLAGCTDANGEGSFNPASQMPAENLGSLVGKIDTGGSWFLIGTSYSGTAGATGSLHLGDNDSANGDNTGSLTVVININGGATSTISTALSVDFGATFATPVSVGTSFDGGMDTEKIGDPILVGTDGQVRIATTSGGSYSDYGSAVPTPAQPTAIFIPRLEFGSTTIQNIETITPEFLVASNVPDSMGEALWKVDTGGTNFIAVTPVDSGNTGTIGGSDCLNVAWRSGLLILGIFDFDGTRKLARSIDGGTSWIISSAVDAAAKCLVTIVNDKLSKKCFFANGASGVGFIADYQTALTVVNKPLPTADSCIIVDAYL